MVSWARKHRGGAFVEGFPQISTGRTLAPSEEPLSRSQLLFGAKVQFARDLYATPDGTGNRAAILVHPVYAFYGLAVLSVGSKVKSDRDPPDHENFILRLYLPYHVRVEGILIEGNLTRRQRARKGA